MRRTVLYTGMKTMRAAAGWYPKEMRQEALEADLSRDLVPVIDMDLGHSDPFVEREAVVGVLVVVILAELLRPWE